MSKNLIVKKHCVFSVNEFLFLLKNTEMKRMFDRSSKRLLFSLGFWQVETILALLLNVLGAMHNYVKQ